MSTDVLVITLFSGEEIVLADSPQAREQTVNIVKKALAARESGESYNEPSDECFSEVMPPERRWPYDDTKPWAGVHHDPENDILLIDSRGWPPMQAKMINALSGNRRENFGSFKY